MPSPGTGSGNKPGDEANTLLPREFSGRVSQANDHIIQNFSVKQEGNNGTMTNGAEALTHTGAF
jgi:hypothetical protein